WGLSPAAAADLAWVLGFVLQYLPRQFDFITTQLEGFSHNTISLSVAGALALVWGSLGVFGAVTTAVNYAWGVTQRSFWTHKLLSFVMLLVAGLILIVALLLV